MPTPRKRRKPPTVEVPGDSKPITAAINALTLAAEREDWPASRIALGMIDRLIPAEAVASAPFEEDTAEWAQLRISEIVLLRQAIGSRDAQGIARLLSEERMYRAMYDEAIEARGQADVSGTDDAIETSLVDALAEVEPARVRRVVLALGVRMGVSVAAWLGEET